MTPEINQQHPFVKAVAALVEHGIPHKDWDGCFLKSAGFATTLTFYSGTLNDEYDGDIHVSRAWLESLPCEKCGGDGEVLWCGQLDVDAAWLPKCKKCHGTGKFLNALKENK